MMWLLSGCVCAARPITGSTLWTGSYSSWSNKEVDSGLLAMLRRDLLPWLETNAPVSAELQPRLPYDPHYPSFGLSLFPAMVTKHASRFSNSACRPSRVGI
jgi:hypothetical protein